MPCFGGGQMEEDTREGQCIEAALCGILSFIESSGELASSFLVSVNWKEAGVTQQWVEGWWEAHKEKDKRRRVYEEAERKRALVRLEAIQKLTPEERAALGIR